MQYIILISDLVFLVTISCIVVCSIGKLVTNDESYFKHISKPAIIAGCCAAITIYLHLMELFVAYYSGAKYELEAYELRWTGPYNWILYLQLLGLILVTLYLFPRSRKSHKYLMISSILALLFCSPYTERIMIMLTSPDQFDHQAS
jgi:hypothetical protein